MGVTPDLRSHVWNFSAQCDIAEVDCETSLTSEQNKYFRETVTPTLVKLKRT